jgi:hypothetical protein
MRGEPHVCIEEYAVFEETKQNEKLVSGQEDILLENSDRLLQAGSLK